MEVFYHGTCRLFDSFDPDRLGSGEGKSKYGHGIYITSSYATAALYASKAAKNNGVDTIYVYTIEVPDLTEDNHVFSCKPVNPKVAAAIEAALGQDIPEEAKAAGKFFRKYVGNALVGNVAAVKKMIGSASSEAENAVANFFNENGIIYLAWPQAQTKPDGDTNRAVLNAECIKILKIEQVHTDAKNKLIKGSETLIKTFV
jgi:hypothetical protein